MTSINVEVKKYLTTACEKNDDEDEKTFLTEDDIAIEETLSPNNFLSLMAANYIKTLEVSDAYKFRTIRHRAHDVSKSFCKRFDELRSDAEQNQAANTYLMVADFVKEDEFNNLVKLFVEDVNIKMNGKSFALYNSVKYIADILDLTLLESLILQYYYIDSSDNASYELSSILEEMGVHNETPAVFFSKTLNYPITQCEEIFKSDTGLFSSGILEPHHRKKNHFKIIDKLHDLLGPNAILNDKILEDRLFPTILDTELELEDYHQREDIEIMSNVINRSIAEKHKGINVLLWGIPGTGKSELPLILAKNQGWNLKVVGDIGKTDNSEKPRNERLLALNVAQRLFRKAENKTVLLFDEMEDLFKFDLNATQSKAFINRIVEKTPVPVIWTTNSMITLGQAIIRRMTFNIPFDKVPPESKRIDIWKKYLTKYNKHVSDKKIEQLARKFDVTPALIANMVKVASFSNLKEDEIDRVMVNLDKAMNLGYERQYDEFDNGPSQFRVEFSNSNMDLNNLTQKIIATGKKNFSILSYGPSGTGKSAYFQYLATEMKMKFRIKKASELMSMWQGETEKNISEMFKSAKEENIFLIIDEADTFFQNRTGNDMRSHEIRQINEMLTGMEKHPLPFCCTTNIEDIIDPAAFRRFTFKIQYDYLTIQQRYNLYNHYFGRIPPTGFLDKMNQLAPGDFANINEKIAFLGNLSDSEIYKMLEEEQEIKPSFKRKMGF